MPEDYYGKIMKLQISQTTKDILTVGRFATVGGTLQRKITALYGQSRNGLESEE